MKKHLPGRVTRRDILQLTTAGVGIAALGPLGGAFLKDARGAPTGNPFVVVVNLSGGNDGINTVPPITLGNYYTRRPNIAIPAGQELSLAGGPGSTAYGLHPALPNLQALWNAGDLAIVNKVGYPTANLSHFTSSDIYSFAVRNDFGPLGIAPSGWVARFADLYAPTSMGAVSVGLGRPLDFVGGDSNPFLVNSLASFRFLPDPAYADNHQYRLEVIRDLLDAYAGTGLDAEVKDALAQGHELADQIQAAVTAYEGFASTADYRASNGVAYNIHRSMQDIARLVYFGFETRVFYTGFGGFDTHGNQGGATGVHASLLDRLDTAIAAFATDMQAMGVWDQTVIVVISEFGRRSDENGSGGLDHGHGNAFLVAGGPVFGGTHGQDLTTADLAGNFPPYATDFRDVYRDVLSSHLGVDPAPVFPEAQPPGTLLVDVV
jgi:uncharacterized protein (DUF1501 family)